MTLDISASLPTTNYVRLPGPSTSAPATPTTPATPTAPSTPATPTAPAAAGSWHPSLDQVGRSSLGAFTGATLAMAAPLALTATAFASGAATAISSAQLALSGVRLGRSVYDSDRLRDSLTKVGIASVGCVASAVGAGLSALALPVSVPVAALSGAWFNGEAPFCLGYFLMRQAVSQIGFNNPDKSPKSLPSPRGMPYPIPTAQRVPTPAQRAPTPAQALPTPAHAAQALIEVPPPPGYEPRVPAQTLAQAKPSQPMPAPVAKRVRFAEPPVTRGPTQRLPAPAKATPCEPLPAPATWRTHSPEVPATSWPAQTPTEVDAPGAPGYPEAAVAPEPKPAKAAARIPAHWLPTLL